LYGTIAASLLTNVSPGSVITQQSMAGGAMATKYRCYLIRNEYIAARETIDCADDVAAIIAAEQILSTTDYTQAEVWDRARMVWIISRKSSAA
jgi:hypothetical protein